MTWQPSAWKAQPGAVPQSLTRTVQPSGTCTVLVNDWGTAPGCAFEADGVHVIMLPGPPSECRPMFHHRAVPYLQALSEGVIASHTLKLFGIGESAHGGPASGRDERHVQPHPGPLRQGGGV